MSTIPKISPTMLSYWEGADGVVEAAVATFRAPASMENCADCAAVLTKSEDGEIVVRVPWSLTDAEIHQLMMGGTLWLSMWGGLPPHTVEVQPPS